MNSKIYIFSLTLLCLSPVMNLSAEELRSDLSDQTSIAVTIYNENLALVRDSRSVSLKQGVQSLAIRDVSAQIRPETALVTASDDTPSSDIRLLEQNFDFDLLTPASLIEKYVGEKVTAVTINPATGNETREQAVVLATNQGIVLQFSDRIETQFPGRLIFDSVPQSLRDRPTLVLMLESGVKTTTALELSYLTSGLGWKADYVASLNDDESAIDLNGWVTLTNQSGTTYKDALLQLVAGDVQQVRERLPQMRAVALESAMADASSFQQESLFDYHLYTLPRSTTLRNQQTKQVALLQSSSVPVQKQYKLRGDGRLFGGRATGEVKQDVGVFVEFDNTQEGNLGMPLPAGVVRVYKNDLSGRTQFIGEDRIDHTPNLERVMLKLGNAFDVKAKTVQTTFQKVVNIGQYNFSAEIGQRITLSNAKKQSVTVQVREVIPGDWQMRIETHGHRKVASNMVEWRIDVPPESSVALEFTALVRY
ncbi:MAG: DUF4139 domain-containing protein [Acidiferrobacterales bacterium]|nr:DUF4139 domain-containing protein [Acidiferrobacterales bacterium]